ncbi:universal stress protein [Rhodocytophaga rosea]|uniref:Universal stress protein n=1 Tax=Rhodocytophaga rosea TaxID=2704465 RepID=A0A6C0GT22_9BACT|nr:universal stress protein [Rhodocytophaga rosea]QHT71299.1 universal stress protein [Rhodocytophaga rosea]
MKTLLVPTDYSPNANVALEYAAEMARFLKARIVLYHAYYIAEISSEATIGLPTEEEQIQENTAKLEAMCRVISNTYQVLTAYATGPLPLQERLPELMKQWRADLIVMGMPFLSNVDRRIFGSTTTSVIWQAQYPVLVVPQDATFEGIKEIMFACDYHSLSPDNTLALLKDLAKTFQSHVSILHVEQEQTREAKDESEVKKLPSLESLLQGVSHDYLFIEAEDAMKGIETGVDDFHADLLVMVPQEHGFWDLVANRSTTRKMAFRTHVPLLTLPNPVPQLAHR